MLECRRCGSVMNRYGEPHECYPSQPYRPRHSHSTGAITGTNVGFWEEHDQRVKQLAAANPDLCPAEVASLATAPAALMANVA